MSRWREMMMDYGDIFGSDKSRANSHVFSIKSDLKEKHNQDLQLRRTLEVHFRPLFQRFVYGGEKIACHDLRRLLHDPEYRDRLPPNKLHELADLADFNRGKAISYNEFVNIVLNQLPMEDLASMGSMDGRSSDPDRVLRSENTQNVLVTVCRNTTAHTNVTEKMQKYRCLPPPFFMILVTLAQILVYIIVNTQEGVSTEAFEGVAKDNAFMYQPDRRREVWRWVTYCLLHQGYVDLIFNVLIQLCLGIPLEMMFSWWRMAIVYVTGVVIGSCGHSIADRYVALVGAAGGSYAIVGAHLVTLVMNWKNFSTVVSESRMRRVLCSMSLRIVVTLLLVIVQVCLAVYRRWFLDDIDMKIGIAAYVGGFLAGSMMSDAFLMDNRRSPNHGGASLFCLFTFMFVAGLTVVINIVWNDYPVEDYS